MTQAKGVLPTKGDDREVLYKNPAMAGYFIGVRLGGAATPDDIKAWLLSVDTAIDRLVARGDPTKELPQARKFGGCLSGQTLSNIKLD
jgi:hypothetical protein